MFQAVPENFLGHLFQQPVRCASHRVEDVRTFHLLGCRLRRCAPQGLIPRAPDEQSRKEHLAETLAHIHGAIPIERRREHAGLSKTRYIAFQLFRW